VTIPGGIREDEAADDAAQRVRTTSDDTTEHHANDDASHTPGHDNTKPDTGQTADEDVSVAAFSCEMSLAAQVMSCHKAVVAERRLAA